MPHELNQDSLTFAGEGKHLPRASIITCTCDGFGGFCRPTEYTLIIYIAVCLAYNTTKVLARPKGPRKPVGVICPKVESVTIHLTMEIDRDQGSLVIGRAFKRVHV